jgi:HEAT repeat protein
MTLTDLIRDLNRDANRVLAAGTTAAAGDAGLRKHARALRALTADVPALAGLAAAADRLARAGPAEAGRSLLGLLFPLGQAGLALAPVRVSGPLEPVESSGPWVTDQPVDVLGLVAAGAGARGRFKRVRRVVGKTPVHDLRAVGPLLTVLEGGAPFAAEWLVEHTLPGFGPALLRELRPRLNLRGGGADANRLLVLCRLDPAAGSALCRQALAAGSATVRAQALASLARIDPDEAERAALGVLVGKPTVRLRQAALAALAGRTDAAVDALLATLPAPRNVWYQAHQVLRGAPRRRVLPRLLREVAAAVEEGEEGEQKVSRLLNLLAARGEREGLLAVLGLLDHALPGFRAAAVRGLETYARARHAGTVAVAELAAALTAPDPKARRMVARVLAEGKAAAQEAVPALVVALRDADEEVREEAAAALGEIGRPPRVVVAALASALADEAEQVRLTAAWALGATRLPGAVPHLVAALREPDGDLREHAAEALGNVGPAARAALPALQDALRDPDGDVRHRAADTLGALGPAARQAIPALIAAAGGDSRWARSSAVRALGKMGRAARAAVPTLTALRDDPDQYVRHAAERAMAEIQAEA